MELRTYSPGGYTMMAGLVTEIVMTFTFLIVILPATPLICSSRARKRGLATERRSNFARPLKVFKVHIPQ